MKKNETTSKDCLMNSIQFLWLGMFRADKAAHNSRNIEMVKELRGLGLDLTMITSYKDKPRLIEGFEYLRVLQPMGIFKLHYMVKAFKFIFQRLKNKRTVLIVGQEEVYLAIVINKLSKIFRTDNIKIHLDIRSQPVAITGLHYYFKHIFFWQVPIFLSKFYVDTFSFITEDIKYLTGIRGKPYCVWSSGANVDKFRSSEIKISKKNIELLYLGSVAKNRGLKEVIAAIATRKEDLKKNNFVFRIVGDGNELEYLNHLARKLNILDIVIFQGCVDYEKVPAFLQSASFFICPLPNHSWWNVSSPIKVFEYLSTGKPLILSKMRAHEFIIKENIPGIVVINDLAPKNIVNGINDVILNYEDYQKYSYERESLAKKFSWKNQAKTLNNFFEECYKDFSIT